MLAFRRCFRKRSGGRGACRLSDPWLGYSTGTKQGKASPDIPGQDQQFIPQLSRRTTTQNHCQVHPAHESMREAGAVVRSASSGRISALRDRARAEIISRETCCLTVSPFLLLPISPLLPQASTKSKSAKYTVSIPCLGLVVAGRWMSFFGIQASYSSFML